MNRRILAVLTGVLALAVVALPSAAQAKAKAKAPRARYYLALGDSLAQGMQPNVQGVTSVTNQGYADDLFATYRSKIKGLKLVKLGCGGDTSQSLATGQGNTTNARLLHCDRKGGSQLSAAERFLKSHHAKGEVPLITLDIGANDVDGCAAAANVGACVTAGITAINTYVPKIVSGIKKAAPKGTKFAGINLYDPVLGGYFSTNSNVKGLALASPVFLKEVNQSLGTDFTNGGFVTADVADAFSSYNSTQTVTWENQQIPVNVATVCAWTWACQTPPTGPNIHANKNGYQVIANSLKAVIGRLK